MSTSSAAVKVIIPKHEVKKLSIFHDIAKKEMMKSCVDGETRMKAKNILKEVNIISFPSPPKDIQKTVRRKIEKEVRKKIKNGYRSKPEYYSIPSWIRKNSTYKKYFLECLEAEIELRKGYMCCWGR